MKPIFGIVGKELTHSFSPTYFNNKFEASSINAEYNVFPLDDIADIRNLIASNPQIQGLNVTVPYKQSVIPYLNDIDQDARQIGAVNCIEIRNGQLFGHNTDHVGFGKTLVKLSSFLNRKVLILGDGGAAQAVKFSLKTLKISFTIVSRRAGNNNITYQQLNENLKEYSIIINTTPLGMFPNIDSFPTIPYEYLTPNHCAYDLIYNPKQTQFLKLSGLAGAHTINGFDMLINQADYSWEIWKNNFRNV